MWKNLFLITIASSIIVTGQLFLKKGLKMVNGIDISGFHDFVFSALRLLQNTFFISGVIIAAIGAFFWLIVISKLDLTTVFPLSGAIFYILLFFISWFFLGESITFWKIIGTIVILLGVFLISK